MKRRKILKNYLSEYLDDDGIPTGWEDVRMTDDEIDRMTDAADAGDIETAERIVQQAYRRLVRGTCENLARAS